MNIAAGLKESDIALVAVKSLKGQFVYFFVNSLGQTARRPFAPVKQRGVNIAQE